mgnify:CR=1 FL=1
MNTPTTRQLLTYRETSERLGIALGTLYCLVCRRRIPHVRLGERTVRFRVEDLDAWIAAGVVPQSGSFSGKPLEPGEIAARRAGGGK